MKISAADNRPCTSSTKVVIVVSGREKHEARAAKFADFHHKCPRIKKIKVCHRRFFAKDSLKITAYEAVASKTPDATYFPRKVPLFSTWYTKNSENRQDSIDQDLDIEADDDVL